jgi:hypothetical protein
VSGVWVEEDASIDVGYCGARLEVGVGIAKSVGRMRQVWRAWALCV